MDIEVGYAEPTTFQNAGHITNFVKYLFNLTPKHENDETKNNLYLPKENNKFFDIKSNIIQKMNNESKPFNDKRFRQIEAKNLADKLISTIKESPNAKVISDIFYFRFNLSNEESINYTDLANELVKQYKNPKLDKLIDFQYLVGHLNQGDYHFHRVMIIKQN